MGNQNSAATGTFPLMAEQSLRFLIGQNDNLSEIEIQ